ncbi:MAG: sodium/proline symporter [Eubacteriales bacterium]|nr:sodium/proline symporter [Eubacteriales bacterium]
MTEKQIIILVAFGAYMLMMILIGALSSKNKNNEDYFLGGRGLGSWTAALSAQASDMSGWLLMGLPGAIYIAGTGEVWIAIGLLIGTILNWFLVAGRLRRYTIKANNSLTIPSFFENRFRDRTGILKIVASLIIILFFAVYTASAFSSGATLFANVFGKSNPTGLCTITLDTEGADMWSNLHYTVEQASDDKANKVTVAAEETSAEGYYLVGTLGGENKWQTTIGEDGKSPYTADRRLTTGGDGQSVVSVNYELSEGDDFRVVYFDGENVTQTATSQTTNNMYIIGLTIAAFVILLYTLMGGFKAVCYTDFIQGILMLIAILAVPIIAYIGLTGEFGSLSNALSEHGVNDSAGYLSLMKDGNGAPISWKSIVSNLGWALGYFGMPHILIRFMAIKSDREVKKSRVIAIVWVILSLGAACILGLFARGFLSNQLFKDNSETVFIKTILQIFDSNYVLIFIGGIFLCGILAAIMSTADSQLLVTASAVSEDMYKGAINKKASEKSSLRIGKIAVIVIAIIAWIIAMNPNSSIMDLVSNAWAGFGAAFGPVVLLSLFWKRFNLAGAIAGMATGAGFVIFWDYIKCTTIIENGKEVAATFGTSTGIYSLVIGFFLAAAVAVLVSLITKAPSKEIQDEFDAVKTVEI